MSRFTACGLTILLAFAPAALAVDGVVLINQSTIANGLTGCPTGGTFPIIICQSGSYRLSGNITVPDASTDAIHINADNVTLDLNGFSILGPVVCSGSPVTSCSPKSNNLASGIGILSVNSNITISNGTVRGLGTFGIELAGTGVLVERVTAFSNGGTGISVANGDAIVTFCHANSNFLAGISGSGTLTNSSALGNGADGVDWGGPATGNVASVNGSAGFAGAGVFTSNVAVRNVSLGFNSNGNPPSVIISNGFYQNGGTIAATSGSVVLNNVEK